MLIIEITFGTGLGIVLAAFILFRCNIMLKQRNARRQGYAAGRRKENSSNPYDPLWDDTGNNSIPTKLLDKGEHYHWRCGYLLGQQDRDNLAAEQAEKEGYAASSRRYLPSPHAHLNRPMPNPYPEDTDEHRRWAIGYSNGYRGEITAGWYVTQGKSIIDGPFDERDQVPKEYSEEKYTDEFGEPMFSVAYVDKSLIEPAMAQ